jgi:hypothetical protein
VNCPSCGAENADDLNFCASCGKQLRDTVVPRGSDEAVATVVPYKNAPALIGYYLGVFSLIPCLGLPLGIAAIPLGIVGLKKRKQHPEIHGAAHAWVAIILGSITTLLWGGILLAAIVTAGTAGQ